MSTVDSDSDLQLSHDLAARERQLRLAQQKLAAQAAALEAERQRLAAELAAARPVTRPTPVPLAMPAPIAAVGTPASAPPAVLPEEDTSSSVEDPDEEAVASRGLLGRFIAAPSWLVSLVVHLVALIILGLLTVQQLAEQAPQEIVMAVAEAPVLESFEEVVIAPPLENVEHQEVNAPDGATLTDVANMTEEIAAGEASTSANTTDLDAVDVGELQDLFGSQGTGLKDLGGGKGTAEFFGVKAGGRKFVFVVDSSNSMRGQKFKDAKEELMYAVRRLDKAQSFYVIFFDKDALCIFEGEGGEAEMRPVPASVPNIRRLEKWLETVEHEGRTDPYDAMKIALEMRPDAIFILSDGQFTDRGRTERYLAESNVMDDPVDGRLPRVVVHTIAFYSRSGEVTMQAIANAYKGTYRFVAPPQKR